LLIFAASGLGRFATKVTVPFLGTIMLLSLSFMVLSPTNSMPYFTSSYTLPYVPSTMMQNTVPLPDSGYIIGALKWLNGRTLTDSILLAPYAFAGWARLYSTAPGIYEYGNIDQITSANFSLYKHVFLIYWS